MLEDDAEYGKHFYNDKGRGDEDKLVQVKVHNMDKGVWKNGSWKKAGLVKFILFIYLKNKFCRMIGNIVIMLILTLLF